MKLALGVDYDLPPVPLDPERTAHFSAGAVIFGVEYRVLTEDVLARTFTAEEREATEIEGVKPGQLQDDYGVSIHVCDAATGREHLRFDCFAEDPHYHYIVPGSGNKAIAFDTTAQGDMLEWALGRLTDRLPEMLGMAGARDLGRRVDRTEVARVLVDVRIAAEEARRTGSRL